MAVGIRLAVQRFARNDTEVDGHPRVVGVVRYQTVGLAALHVQSIAFRDQGSGLRAQGSGLRAQGSGLRVQGVM